MTRQVEPQGSELTLLAAASLDERRRAEQAGGLTEYERKFGVTAGLPLSQWEGYEPDQLTSREFEGIWGRRPSGDHSPVTPSSGRYLVGLMEQLPESVDRDIVVHRITFAINTIREARAYTLHEALDVFAERYEELRRDRPDDFAVSREDCSPGLLTIGQSYGALLDCESAGR
jgi:hypothetical protein